MHYRFLPILATFLCISLISCTPEESKDDGPKTYYDLKGFVENQIEYLNDKRPEVNKTAILGSKREVSRTRDVDWKKELELFVQADINKPSYRQSYDILQNGPVYYEYRLKPGNDLPVTYLKIETDSVLKQPLYVEALLRARNKIYHSEKKVILKTVKRDNLLEVNAYQVDGYQKLIFVDRKTFRIQGQIGL
ncbi:hypothetical protein GCM10010967_04070 [Dyadobacter beijingensis]|uniref:Uncharacterized protein n=1 Tax=Dyadobacter beijingensis TaxID=365489 RepID=A0ABQ2HDU9_9BACT|nr:hypothetical protein [Dyadobacter beijingensis]GGM75697.1 hypothetical protein GCM10010967_04070 [Dyadobacter beijingensis]